MIRRLAVAALISCTAAGATAQVITSPAPAAPQPTDVPLLNIAPRAGGDSEVFNTSPAAGRTNVNIPTKVTTIRCQGEYNGVELTGLMTRTYIRNYGVWSWAGAFTTGGGENYTFEGNGDELQAVGTAIPARDWNKPVRIAMNSEPSGFAVTGLDAERVGIFTCG